MRMTTRAANAIHPIAIPAIAPALKPLAKQTVATVTEIVDDVYVGFAVAFSQDKTEWE